MSFEQAIEELAQRYGVEPFYWDIQGVQHVASIETKCALLRAMELDVSDEHAARKEIKEFDDRNWRETAPPVFIHPANHQGFSLPLKLRAEEVAETLEWKVSSLGLSGSIPLASIAGEQVGILANGEKRELKHVWIELALPSGYHELSLGIGSESYSILLLSPPERCYFPPLEKKIFGISGQLYSFSSDRNCGAGDLGDVLNAIPAMSEAGVSFLGLNPLHALFEGDGDSISPYSPCSRLAWNSLIVACDGEKNQNAKSSSDLVDYTALWKKRRELLEAKYRSRSKEVAAAFQKFAADAPQGLKDYALYSALREHLLKEDAKHWGWPAWPKKYQDSQSKAVKDFAKKEKELVEFYLFEQFLADSELEAVQRSLVEGGVSLGLYLDVALGPNSGGAETWTRQTLYAFSASLGAPPDELGPLGQVWGLPPLLPHRLRAARFEVFREALSLTMSRAAAVRIDHIMSLFRLFWIPEGKTAREGAYVRYPFEDLLAIVAIESERHRCLVVGEDLGTVPDEVRAGMARLGILSYKVLYFMHHDRNFLPSSAYSQEALVVTSTHDLPTLRSFWTGADIEVRKQLKLFNDDSLYNLSKSFREADRQGMSRKLQEEGFSEFAEAPPQTLTEDQTIAFHAFLARSPSVLQAIQLEDLALLGDQANVPGTVHEHPNWQRKLPKTISEILGSVFAKKLLGTVRRTRG